MSAERRLLVATGSRHKFAELAELLSLPATQLLSLADAGLTDSAVEDGATFEDNARLKALHYAVLSGLPTLADDSGLEVDALDGRPGIFTRRYAGPNATDDENNALLLAELLGLGVEGNERTARYRCVLALAEFNPTITSVKELASGTFEGRIAVAPRGEGGFGYDPIFEPASEPVGGRTVGQLNPAEKNQISHRAQAAREMRTKLIARGY